MKRAGDVVVSGLAVLVLTPVALVVVAAVVASLGLPIFFSDERVGLAGSPIAIRKLRTMTNEKDDRGEFLSDAQRLSLVGRFIRALSLDELPQLVSVLRGEMSLVGPRPLPTRYFERYSPEQARRHEVKPGITGLAQVSGRNLLSWDEKFALDVWYVDNWSLWLDVKILFRTLWQVMKRTGIQADGEATMAEFLGTAGVSGTQVVARPAGQSDRAGQGGR
ncbi:MAG: sugar transferase [bacterium]